jgi:hypothetical protein
MMFKVVLTNHVHKSGCWVYFIVQFSTTDIILQIIMASKSNILKSCSLISMLIICAREINLQVEARRNHIEDSRVTALPGRTHLLKNHQSP